jgi:1-phosphofructokinase
LRPPHKPSDARAGPPPADMAPARDAGRAEAAGPEIVVLAPSPLFTVTIERNPDGADEVYFHAGGQGFWVARMVSGLAARATLCGPFGGETGTILKVLVGAEEIAIEPVSIRGWNGGYVHDRRGGERQLIAEMRSPRLNRHEIDDLYDAALAAGLRARTMVLTGTVEHSVLPAHFYRRIARDLGRHGVTVVADVSNDELKALAGGIDFLKIGHTQLVQSGYCRDTRRPSLLESMKKLQETGARNIIISCAEEPSLAFIAGQLLEIVPPVFDALDFRGAGDSMTAALAFARATGMDMEPTLRLAAAAGAMNVTRHGLGTGHIEHIREVAKHVAIRKLE